MSSSGLHPPPTSSIQQSVIAYSETLSAERAPLNICVLLVVPGTFDVCVIPPITETLPGYEGAHDVMDAALKTRELVDGAYPPTRQLAVY